MKPQKVRKNGRVCKQVTERDVVRCGKKENKNNAEKKKYIETYSRC